MLAEHTVILGCHCLMDILYLHMMFILSFIFLPIGLFLRNEGPWHVLAVASCLSDDQYHIFSGYDLDDSWYTTMFILRGQWVASRC